MNLYSHFLTTKPVDWKDIKPLSNEKVTSYSSLPEIPNNESAQLLKRLVVVKLNGGLGTTMGCSRPKSMIIVRDGMNFLDLTLVQLNALNKKFNCDIPLVLMNSFYTHAETNRVIHKYHNSPTKIYTFKQSQYPRISADTLSPIVNQQSILNNSSWYPPGHGNFYESIYESGLLQKFIDEGRDIVFVSNIDNLGATVDSKILKVMTKNASNNGSADFLFEITEKTKADIKGGVIVENNGVVQLLEIAQVPREHVEDFKKISTFKYFNTNNIWLNLKSLLNKISQSPLDLDVITNRKNLSDGQSVIQLETAIGAAVKNFDKCIGVNVPRSRFLPVKSNSDLLLVMSNLYSLSDGILVMNPKRDCKTTPLIQLSGAHFKNVTEFLDRFSKIPDILELDYLSVSGDVRFDRDVVLKGTIIVLAQHGDHIDIPRGSILENKIVTGNLRVIEH